MPGDRLGMPDNVLGRFAQEILLATRLPKRGHFPGSEATVFQQLQGALLGLGDPFLFVEWVFKAARQGAPGFGV